MENGVHGFLCSYFVREKYSCFSGCLFSILFSYLFPCKRTPTNTSGRQTNSLLDPLFLCTLNLFVALNGNPNQFIVGGASKRGFATWSVGAVDPRVIAMVPIVMDELNFVKNMHHHFRAYGGWSFALDDFYKMNVTDMLDDEKFQKMQDIVDVYEYRDKLLVPKLVISATGDEFFVLDNTRFFIYLHVLVVNAEDIKSMNPVFKVVVARYANER